jgi:hypothetical protein
VTESVQKARDAAERVIAVCEILASLIPPDVDASTADLRTQWAVEMGLNRIGEAVNRIPDEVLELFSEQPWRQPASYVSHVGERPIAITWEMQHAMPSAFFESATLAAS